MHSTDDHEKLRGKLQPNVLRQEYHAKQLKAAVVLSLGRTFQLSAYTLFLDPPICTVNTTPCSSTYPLIYLMSIGVSKIQSVSEWGETKRLACAGLPGASATVFCAVKGDHKPLFFNTLRYVTSAAAHGD